MPYHAVRPQWRPSWKAGEYHNHTLISSRLKRRVAQLEGFTMLMWKIRTSTCLVKVGSYDCTCRYCIRVNGMGRVDVEGGTGQSRASTASFPPPFSVFLLAPQRSKPRRFLSEVGCFFRTQRPNQDMIETKSGARRN
ncbi:hypothetical protein GE21DRAFT_1007696 [Neurospora crassa]|nr:hypothetical protein GE21DRAFT_1007696 [Neurospora crassa]